MLKPIITGAACLLGLLFLDSACQNKSPISEQERDAGQEVYLAHCVSCHGPEGDGNQGFYPSLAGRKIDSAYTRRAIRLITQGSGSDVGMRPIGLDPDELRDVINYIQNSWGNEAPALSSSQSAFSLKLNP